MNQNNTLDWSGIKTAAITLGSVNAAAIQAGANLPPDEAERLRERINKRALRERWMNQARTLQATAPTNAKPLSNSVQNGADIVANALADDECEVKTNLSKALRKTAGAMQNMAGEALYATADKAKQVVGAATQLYRWDQDKGPGISIQILNSQGSMQ